MAAFAPTLYNVAITTQDTEYSQVLPADVRVIKVKCRTAADIRFAWVTGKVAASTAPFWTIKSGMTETIEVPAGLTGGAPTLYVGAGAGSLVAEIMALS